MQLTFYTVYQLEKFKLVCVVLFDFPKGSIIRDIESFLDIVIPNYLVAG
ncbi:hypothetical protein QWZ13_14260 [Reinekea marina]|nr:hypothetical protein [Reinekea marina]MDN3650079.1 hypothetical protein [Reinekea marina]